MPRGRPIHNDLLLEIRERGKLVDRLRELGLTKKSAAILAENFPDGRGLSDASMSALTHLGVPTAQAKKVIAVFAVAGLCDAACQDRAGTVRQPSEVAELVRRVIGKKPQEYFVVVLLDARQQVIDVLGIAIGSLSAVEVHPRELFREAIRRQAHSVVIAHNHPTGDSSPSEADIDLTQRMVKVGRMTGIPVLDHVVVSPRNFTSLAAEGLIPNPTKKRTKSRKNRTSSKKTRGILEKAMRGT